MERQPWRPGGAEPPPGQVPGELKRRAWLRSPAMWALVLGTVVSVLGGLVFWTYASQRESGGGHDPLGAQHTPGRP